MRHMVPLIAHMLPEGSAEKIETLQVHLVRDRHIITINHQHLQCLGPTNVLSFPPDCIVLSLDTLRRECLLYAQDEVEHMLRLLAHGLGHLLGFDHGLPMDTLCASMEEAGRQFMGKHR